MGRLKANLIFMAVFAVVFVTMEQIEKIQLRSGTKKGLRMVTKSLRKELERTKAGNETTGMTVDELLERCEIV